MKVFGRINHNNFYKVFFVWENRFYRWPHKSNLEDSNNSAKDIVRSCRIRKGVLSLVALTCFSVMGCTYSKLAEDNPKIKEPGLEILMADVALGLVGLVSGAKARGYHLFQKNYECSDPRYSEKVLEDM